MSTANHPQDLPAEVVNLLHRIQQQDVRQTYRLIGQESGLADLPDEDEEWPLEGLFRDIKRWASRAFEQLVIALVILTLLGLSLTVAGSP